MTIYWEVEQGSQITDVQGRVQKSLVFWLGTLDPAPWIISCVKEGYKLPLRAIPNKFIKPNQQSALNHRSVLQKHNKIWRKTVVLQGYFRHHMCVAVFQ